MLGGTHVELLFANTHFRARKLNLTQVNEQFKLIESGSLCLFQQNFDKKIHVYNVCQATVSKTCLQNKCFEM